MSPTAYNSRHRMCRGLFVEQTTITVRSDRDLFVSECRRIDDEPAKHVSKDSNMCVLDHDFPGAFDTGKLRTQHAGQPPTIDLRSNQLSRIDRSFAGERYPKCYDRAPGRPNSQSAWSRGRTSIAGEWRERACRTTWRLGTRDQRHRDGQSHPLDQIQGKGVQRTH